MELQNKVIVITGASDGIGKEIALRLAKEKTKLALIGLNDSKLQDVAKLCLKLGAIDVKAYSCDIRTDKLNECIKLIITHFNGVDVLINNAGIWQKLMLADEIDETTIKAVLDTNLYGMINTTRLLLGELKKKDEGAIINVISRSGVTAQANQSVYSASKYGARGFTEVLKEELKDTHVKVAGVYQGGTNTTMFAKAGEQFSTASFTEPADLADVIAYMLTRPAKLWIHEIKIDK